MRVLVASLLLAAGPAPAPAPPATGGVLQRIEGAVRRGLEWWPRRRRAAARREAPAFGHLAASQVGYGPGLPKRFTSPARFGSFRVLREADGAVAFQGGAPERAVGTDLLGDLHTVWIGDFTALRAPGRYRIVAADGLSSHPFSVGADVFDGPIRAVQRSFYYQRAFTAVARPYAEGPWVHPSDAGRAPPGVVEGWHDAGDLSVYSGSVNVAVFWLLETYQDFAPAADDTNIPESGNGVPDLLDEARWGLEWLLSVQEASGGFRNTTCQEGYGPYGTNTPEGVPRYRNGEVGTMATARAVGSLAYGAAVFRRFDAAFARRCLEAAREGYRYLRAHAGESTDGPTCPANRRDGDPVAGRQVRMYAAAGMLLATGERRYREDFARNEEELGRVPDANHMSGYAARLYLRAAGGDPARRRALRRRMLALADEAAADGRRHPFEWAGDYAWGSIGDAFHRTATYGAWGCLGEPGRPDDCRQALANVDYVLGRNLLQLCYVTGLDGTSHATSWAFHHWLRTLDATPHDFPGMIAGGPNRAPEPADRSWPAARPFPIWGYWGDPAMPRDAATPIDGRYADNDSWSTNEMGMPWQAVALYSLHLARWLARGGPVRPGLPPDGHDPRDSRGR